MSAFTYTRFLKYFLPFTLFIGLVAWSISMTGCAVIVPPSGGPKDSLPPVLLSAVPNDSTTNFTSKQIVLTFDEYITLDNVQEQLIVSPYQKRVPKVTSKLKTITIDLKDTLKPNTTYSFDFGRSIKDVNEGNPFRNYIYAFSTGDKLDKGEISGKVTMAETGNIDTTLIVVLHTKNLDDTAIQTLPPDYYTRVDTAGKFKFKFLPSGTYNVYALPNDYSKEYRDSTQIFAFYNEQLKISDSTDVNNVQLFAYQEFKEEKGGNGGMNGDGNTPPPNEEEHSKKDKKKKEKKEQLVVNLSLKDGRQDLLNPLYFTFSQPLKDLDTSKIAFLDTNFVRIPDMHLTAVKSDTTNSKFEVQFPWKENQYFKIIMDSTAAIDSADGWLAKNDTISFQTQDEADYASILISFPDIDMSRHPVLDLLQNDKIVDSLLIENKRVVRKLYPSGEYGMRILYDENQNMHWDPGNYQVKKQPELVEKIKSKFRFKPNWDNEQEIFLKGTGK